MRRLSDVVVKGDNNFNLLRLLAVIAVLWGHQWLNFGGAHPDHVRDWLRIEYSGSLAVYVFFLISGMLVTASADRQGSPWRFVMLRFARIWPALAVCNIAVLVVFGPILAGVDAKTFWDLPFTFGCLDTNLRVYNMMCTAHPLIFKHAIAPTTWANSFWTLSLEVHCYFLVLLLSLTPALKNRSLLTFSSIVIVAAFLFATHDVVPNSFAMFDFLVLGGYSFYPIPFFFAGAVLYAWREKVVIDWRICLALTLLFLLTRTTWFCYVSLYAALIYGTLWFAASSRIRAIWNPRNDYSYGLYIYGYLVGQIIEERFPGIDSIVGFAVTWAVSLCVAALSWHLVEKPSLRICRKLIGRSPRDVLPRISSLLNGSAPRNLPRFASGR